MVAYKVGEGGGLRHGVFSHGDSTRSGEVVFRDFAAFLLVVSSREENRLPVDHRLYAAAIAIEGELRVNESKN
jgi:hypothetical protein